MNARRFSFCRTCDTETPQKFAGHERVPVPVERWTEYYRCDACSTVLITYADVEDSEGLILTFYAKRTRGSGSIDFGDAKSLEREDVLGHLRASLFAAYRNWRPAQCRFRAYAWTKLGHEWLNYMRVEVGYDSRWARPVPKMLNVARSLDAITAEFEDESDAVRGTDERGPRSDPLERAFGQDAGDLLNDRIPDLEREVSRRGRGIAREVERLGVRKVA